MRNRKRIYYATIVLLVAIVIIIALALVTPVSAAYNITTARQDALHADAEALRALGFAEDSDELQALKTAWWAEQENLDIVARVVQGEAGGCPWMHQIAVAAVVVNRVKSPLFPNSVREVVAAPMQYTTLYLRDFDRTSEQCYLAAKKALDGESGVPEDVVWQAQFPQGTETWWKSYVDTGYWKSTTWFCR